jgi:hypothetical protein
MPRSSRRGGCVDGRRQSRWMFGDDEFDTNDPTPRDSFDSNFADAGGPAGTYCTSRPVPGSATSAPHTVWARSPTSSSGSPTPSRLGPEPGAAGRTDAAAVATDAAAVATDAAVAADADRSIAAVATDADRSNAAMATDPDRSNAAMATDAARSGCRWLRPPSGRRSTRTGANGRRHSYERRLGARFSPARRIGNPSRSARERFPSRREIVIVGDRRRHGNAQPRCILTP